MTTSSASTRKGLTKIATNRLQKEFMEWQTSPPAGFKHRVSDNLQRYITIPIFRFIFEKQMI
ncbi:hypothetical protein F2Q70_00033854 [Brassica cretica]|uniref:Uncharacterized protein n=1 Tax=Brassica cretica TaxID=69181 RepID=A0A8S9JNW2_BRACR|nr:hypothetical protein F2Q70_00033854 [Brassica cretica]